jgi:hypothetical protein
MAVGFVDLLSTLCWGGFGQGNGSNNNRGSAVFSQGSLYPILVRPGA